MFELLRVIVVRSFRSRSHQFPFLFAVSCSGLDVMSERQHGVVKRSIEFKSQYPYLRVSSIFKSGNGQVILVMVTIASHIAHFRLHSFIHPDSVSVCEDNLGES